MSHGLKECVPSECLEKATNCKSSYLYRCILFYARRNVVPECKKYKEDFVQLITNNLFSFDVICLQESKLLQSSPDDMLKTFAKMGFNCALAQTPETLRSYITDLTAHPQISRKMSNFRNK